MPERVRYKLCLLVFKAIHGPAPDYLSELCRSNAEDAAHSRHRSAAHSDFHVPCSKTNFSDRAHAVAGPASWNRLPATIQSSDTLQNFKNQLKAHFFWWTISFSFLFISSAGTLELDSMSQRLRKERFIIIIIYNRQRHALKTLMQLTAEQRKENHQNSRQILHINITLNCMIKNTDTCMLSMFCHFQR